MKSHLKSTPFACPICRFKSGRKDNLKQHVEKRHCSSNTSIKQLEEQYPDMYKMHESCEAAEIAKNEAIAAHKEKMAQETKFSESAASESILTNMLLPEQNHSLVMVAQPADGTLSENMSKYIIEQQIEKKYIPNAQTTNHAVKFLTESHETKYIPSEHERLMQQQQQRLVMEQNDRYERERVLNEQREREHRLIQEQRERYENEQRERMLAEQRERDRILREQREIQQQRLLAEQRERERLTLDVRDRMFTDQRDRIASNNLAEVYQRIRSLNPQ